MRKMSSHDIDSFQRTSLKAETLDMPIAQQWAKTLNIEKARVIRLSGLHKEHDYEYKTKDLEENAREPSNVDQQEEHL
ncbi:hypothetical protein C0J52_07759 [Blattella germanica]|nr:hypothetical protein C0J52_07759 [Blattella germanica]